MKDDQAFVDSMTKEAQDTGFKPVFEADEKAESPKKPEADETAKKEEGKQEVKTEEAKTEKQTRQSRAPFREVREQIREGLEKKYEDKYGKELNELKNTIEELKKGNLSKTEIGDLKKDIESLANELNIKPDALEKIVSVSRKGLESELSEVKTKLTKYEEIEKQRSEDKIIAGEEENFKLEVNDILPKIREQYPNATKEQIEKAVDKLDELAHTEAYDSFELDYVLYKEAKEFEKILFSPKVRGFESESTSEENVEEADGDIFTSKAPTTIKELEKMERRTKKFEESLPDSRMSFK